MPSPVDWSSVVSVSLTGSQTIDALLAGAKWAGSTLTYSFPERGSLWSTDSTTGYGPRSEGKEPWSASFTPLSGPGAGDDQVYFKGALQTWANVANLQFSQVADTSTIVGDIRAAYTYQNEHANDQAWAYLPAEAPSAGDIWFNVIGSSAVDYWTPGGRSYFAVLHELGHVLGLKHPFEEPTKLPTSLDSESYTIMSYAAKPGEDSTQFSFNPTTPMLLDIATIQQLYGANYNYHSGSDIHSYSDSATYHETIWDGGGSDAIQYSGNRNATIDLREGKGSRIGLPVEVQDSSGALLYETDNVWIAYGAIVENAIGGSGNDLLTGNTGNNVLDGSAGADKLDGGAGNDSYVVDNPGDVVTENSAMGTDTVRSSIGYTLGANVENLTLTGTGAVNGSGNSLDNLIAGNSANNALNGAEGIDTVRFGGTSSDYFLATYATSLVVIPRTESARLLDGMDTLTNIELLSFGQDGSTRSASGADNKVFGLKYVASYPDLIAAFGSGADAGIAHYINHGWYEGRSATFDGLKYIASYPDLIAAFGTSAEAGAGHFIQSGLTEGRTATFDALKYTASYGDLINAFGTNTIAAETHYINNGYAEGRAATFDALRYTASYGDLINAFGTNTIAAETHYINNGYAEDRTATFDGQSYVAANLDLLAAFGLDPVAGERHYIQDGYREGRETSLSSMQRGGGGDDVLTGTAGKDLLDGGAGRDTLGGGAGQDIFVLRAGDGGAILELADLITDFQDGTDRLGLAGSLTYANLNIQQGNGTHAAATTISTGSGEVLAILDNLLSANLNGQDFVHL